MLAFRFNSGLESLESRRLLLAGIIYFFGYEERSDDASIIFAAVQR